MLCFVGGDPGGGAGGSKPCGEDGWVEERSRMIWLRRVGLVLFLGGFLSSWLTPMWGSSVLLASVPLIIVGVVLLVVGMGRRHSGDSAVGGLEERGPGPDTSDSDFHSPGGHDGGHGGDGGY